MTNNFYDDALLLTVIMGMYRDVTGDTLPTPYPECYWNGKLEIIVLLI